MAGSDLMLWVLITSLLPSAGTCGLIFRPKRSRSELGETISYSSVVVVHPLGKKLESSTAPSKAARIASTVLKTCVSRMPHMWRGSILVPGWQRLLMVRTRHHFYWVTTFQSHGAASLQMNLGWAYCYWVHHHNHHHHLTAGSPSISDFVIWCCYPRR